MSRTCGLISRAANSRTLSRKRASSSVSRVSGAGVPGFSTARECYHSEVMTKGRRCLAYCVLAAAFAAPLTLAVNAQDAPAQQPPSAPAPAAPASPEQTPIFRADINFVRVDVIVTDRQGNPVHDLKQEDFEVTEDGKPQSIQTFKLVNVSEDTGVGNDPPREIRNVI